MVALSHLSILTLASLALANTDFLSSGITPQEYLETNPPNVILSTEFPSPELHSLWEDWKGTARRVYESEKESALRKLIWLENHGMSRALRF